MVSTCSQDQEEGGIPLSQASLQQLNAVKQQRLGDREMVATESRGWSRRCGAWSGGHEEKTQNYYELL